ncbi:MAG: response regulator [Deltaproteobacteria bacterium]|nr:response regulator [Deltaproteobacteria bacterium]
MAILGLFRGEFCADDAFVDRLSEAIGYSLVRDDDVVTRAGADWGMPETKLRKAFSSRPFLFNPFTHEKERSIAFLRVSLAQAVTDKGCIVDGFTMHLLPFTVDHVLRVCLVAERAYRAKVGMSRLEMPRDEIMARVLRDDADRSAWVERIHGIADPWTPSLYDMVLPMDKMSSDAALRAIEENLQKEVLQPSEESLRAMDDFRLAARVAAALARAGHSLELTASSGQVTVNVRKSVLLMGRLEEELREILSTVEGVETVTFRTDPEERAAEPYRRYDPATPSRILLVDDERDFAQSLSERLTIRDMGSIVAYDGESALEVVKADEPEVMVLDLKMPGIDGIEVLRRIKKSRPDIEVIILTGRGTEADREVCMQLGAFAYLEKPVDIELLSTTLRLANEKVQGRGREGRKA